MKVRIHFVIRNSLRLDQTVLHDVYSLCPFIQKLLRMGRYSISEGLIVIVDFTYYLRSR